MANGARDGSGWWAWLLVVIIIAIVIAWGWGWSGWDRWRASPRANPPGREQLACRYPQAVRPRQIGEINGE